MADDCLFCRIAAGALPAHRVYEDDRILAFLDLHPIRPGHTLVIPKAHHVWFEDLPEDLAAAIAICGQRLARAMKRLYGVERVAFFYTGIHVPHVHAHLVPMQHVHDVTSRAYLGDDPDRYAVPPQFDPEAGAATARDLAALLSA